MTWRLAVVEGLIRGRDEYVRAANIRTASDKTNRPIKKLYPLEVRAATKETDLELKDCVQEVNLPQINQDNHLRPKRPAACKAADLMKKWAQELRAPPEDVVNH